MSFVTGTDGQDYLQKRYDKLAEHPCSPEWSTPLTSVSSRSWSR